MSLFSHLFLATLAMSFLISCSGDQEQMAEVTEQQAAPDTEATQQDNAELVDASEDGDENLDEFAIDEADAEESAMLALVAGDQGAAPDQTAAPAANTGPSVALGDYWVFVQKARLYAQPEVGSEVVGSVDYGAKVTAQDKKNGWIHVGQGWVQVWKLTDRTTGFAHKKNVYFITAPDAVVHAEPKTDAAAVGKMTHGERIVVSGSQGGWLQIGDGQFIEKTTVGRSRPAH